MCKKTKIKTKKPNKQTDKKTNKQKQNIKKNFKKGTAGSQKVGENFGRMEVTGKK